MEDSKTCSNLSSYQHEKNSNSDEDERVVTSSEALLNDRDSLREGSSGIRNIVEFTTRLRHKSEDDRGAVVINHFQPYSSAKEMSSKIEVDDTISPTRKYIAVFVLFLINLINYMDRFTIAGVLLQIMDYFRINNAMGGLLQTVFIISYMIAAPLFGYLGDRYNRKIVMLVGMAVWSGCTLWASFIDNRNNFVYFLVLRGMVGIGEASYSTIAPTIIADLFVKSKRTRMLSVFFFAIPVGSGLGYIVGSAAAQVGGSWHWALRVTPALGLLTMVLLVLVIPDVRRGASETSNDLLASKKVEESRSSYLDDLGYIFKNKSFVCVTTGLTFMAFVVGSLTIWGPVYVAYSQVVVGTLNPCARDSCEYGNVSFIFGLITCIAGFIGVWVGAESAKRWKDQGQDNADALVCAIGLILAGPFLFCGFHLVTSNLPAAWIMIFFADVCLCLTWTLVGDMTLYVTMPSRRSTANAVQILTMHLLGDAGSPYLLGVMSDVLKEEMPDTFYAKFLSLQRSIYVPLFASILGGCGFLFASLYLKNDKKKVDDCLAGKKSRTFTPQSTESNNSVELNKVPLCYDESLAAASPIQEIVTSPMYGDYSISDDTENLLIQREKVLEKGHKKPRVFISSSVGADFTKSHSGLMSDPIVMGNGIDKPIVSSFTAYGQLSGASDESDGSANSNLNLLASDTKETII